MGHGRIVLILLSMVVGFSAIIHIFTAAIAPPEVDQTVMTFSLSRPRAPEEARRIENPILFSREAVQKGDEIYHGKGNCHVCHGDTGKGDGQAGVLLAPKPTDLTDPNFHLLRKDGEMFWSIKHGVEGTGMFAYAPRMISEEEAWTVIHYIRTLKAIK
ncbi:MAG: c-type cytochrome [Nitrospiria bacterium]